MLFRSGDLSNDKIEEFVTDYLRSDGIFLIRLIGHNCNFITTNDITASLWEEYIENQKKKNDDLDGKQNGRESLLKEDV